MRKIAAYDPVFEKYIGKSNVTIRISFVLFFG